MAAKAATCAAAAWAARRLGKGALLLPLSSAGTDGRASRLRDRRRAVAAVAFVCCDAPLAALVVVPGVVLVAVLAAGATAAAPAGALPTMTSLLGIGGAELMRSSTSRACAEMSRTPSGSVLRFSGVILRSASVVTCWQRNGTRKEVADIEQEALQAQCSSACDGAVDAQSRANNKNKKKTETDTQGSWGR